MTYEIKFRTVKMADTITKGRQAYRGQIVSPRAKGIAETADDLARLLKNVDAPTIRYVLDGLVERLPQMIAADGGCPRKLGNLVTFMPRIGGTFPAKNAKFDPERNSIYLTTLVPHKIRSSMQRLVTLKNMTEPAQE